MDPNTSGAIPIPTNSSGKTTNSAAHSHASDSPSPSSPSPLRGSANTISANNNFSPPPIPQEWHYVELKLDEVAQDSPMFRERIRRVEDVRIGTTHINRFFLLLFFSFSNSSFLDLLSFLLYVSRRWMILAIKSRS